MKISDFEILCAVAEEKSFIKAARRLYISQSAVTQHIKKIEQELGFALFARNNHFVELTAQGETMVEAAREILKRYHQALASCCRELDTVQDLRVCYVGPSSFTFLPDVIHRFRDSFPDCQVTTRRIRPDQVVSSLEKRETNLIFTPFDLISHCPQFHFYPLYEEYHYCVMNKANPLAVLEQVGFDDLRGRMILAPSKPFRPGHMIAVLERIRDLRIPCRIGDGHNVDNVLIQLRSSEKDAVAIMPGFAVPDHSQICALPFQDGITIRMGFAYRDPLNRLEKAFASTARNDACK